MAGLFPVDDCNAPKPGAPSWRLINYHEVFCQQCGEKAEHVKLSFDPKQRFVVIHDPGDFDFLDLYKGIRVWEASEEGIVFPEILEGSGNIPLAGRDASHGEMSGTKARAAESLWSRA